METTGTHAPRGKLYLIVFLILALLTALEVGVASVHGSRNAVVVALFGLALVKAASVALFYMHLKWETRLLRGLFLIPLALPVFYALVLITEAAWRRVS
jgi:caa(3)-type oxidase subunit IV